jgi:hypothetical protein
MGDPNYERAVRDRIMLNAGIDAAFETFIPVVREIVQAITNHPDPREQARLLEVLNEARKGKQ